MKSYLLSFAAYDFLKNGKTWITEPVDLYANKYYTNFSVQKSRRGLNTLGDYTFVGTEKNGSIYIILDSDEYATPVFVYLNEAPEATPEFLIYTDPTFDYQATPTLDGAVFMTNYGEIIEDPATPSYLRFVDTSSRIDVRSFRGAFVNGLGGLESVTFSLNVYESDNPSGPWLLSTTTSSMSSGTLMLARDAKRYAKFEVIIETEVTDLESLAFSLLIEIAISDPISPVLSSAAKNILKKFPSWTKVHGDSVDQEQEDLFIPNSVGGKFIQSILNDSLDHFDSQVDGYNLNRFLRFCRY
jgi:hypothetical protein